MSDWIKYSERKPEERESMFAKFYGTDKFKPGIMFRTHRHNLLFTLEHHGERFVAEGRMLDGKPMCSYLIIHNDAQVIAWMPFPEPFEEEDE